MTARYHTPQTTCPSQPFVQALVEAMVLLAGVFEATFVHDAEWLVAAVIGGIIGRMRGWTIPIAVDHVRDLVRVRRSFDGQLAAAALVLFALVDFTGAALEDPLIACQYTAAGAAFFAGFLVFRALSVAVRAMRSPHVELLDPHRVNTTSPI